MKLYYCILLFFVSLFPLVVNAQNLAGNQPDLYDSAKVVRSKCQLDHLGYCSTKAAIYVWQKQKGSIINFATEQIIHCKEAAFIIVLGDADNKGIYTIEASGNDSGTPPSVRLVFIPYKGKTADSLLPDSLFSLDEKPELQRKLIVQYMEEHLKKIKRFSPLAKKQLKLYTQSADENCEEYIKSHKHPGWVLKADLTKYIITWDIDIGSSMCWCTFKWRKHVKVKR
jgi:hypothetical protein